MSEIFKIWDTYISPATDELLDIGSSVLEFKDLYIDGIAYIDGFGEDTDLGDFDIHSLDGLYGLDNDIFIDLGNDGRIIIQADGVGTPFSTPDIDITGSSFFDDDIGFDTTKGIYFRDAGIYINSNDDGRLDITADIAIDFNADNNFIFYEGDLVSYEEDSVFYN